jgi:hypothetical protein
VKKETRRQGEGISAFSFSRSLVTGVRVALIPSQSFYRRPAIRN